MRLVFLTFCRDRSGATAIEYGLIAGLVCVTLIAAIGLLGGENGMLFGTVGERVAAALSR